MTNTDIDWIAIGEQLRNPFDPSAVDFRVQGRANEQTGKAQIVAFIDARLVQNRLDEVVGPGNWAFEWEPVVIDKGDVQVAKGTLTIHGVSKSDVGTASNFEASLGAVSHCFKRAAVHWGIGRYLYDIPITCAQVEKNGRISDQVLRELRNKLPRPASAKPAAANAPVARQEAQRAAVTSEAPQQQTVRMATPAQITTLRKAGELLDRAVPATATLTYDDAEKLAAAWRAEWKKKNQLQPPIANATPAAAHDLSEMPMAKQGVRP